MALGAVALATKNRLPRFVDLAVIAAVWALGLYVGLTTFLS